MRDNVRTRPCARSRRRAEVLVSFAGTFESTLGARAEPTASECRLALLVPVLEGSGHAGRLRSPGRAI